MKKNWYVVSLMVLLLLAAVPSFAQNLLVRATCADTVADGSIATGTDFAIIVELYNDYGSILGGSLPLTIYSPNDSASVIQVNVSGKPVVNFRTGPSDYYTDSCIQAINGWDALWVALNDYNGASWDGNLPDTINWSGLTFGGYGVDAGFTGRIQINYTAGPTAGRICIDSCEIPNTVPPGKLDWLWDDGGAVFNGPYCWDVKIQNGVTAINTDNLLPIDFALDQNYPNPFNPTTNIEFAIKTNTHVNIAIFNILGQKVSTLADREFEAGYYQATWDGTDNNGTSVASGMYFYRLEADDFTDTKKMIMLK